MVDFSIEMSNILSSLIVEHDLTFIQFRVPHHTSLKFNSEFTLKAMVIGSEDPAGPQKSKAQQVDHRMSNNLRDDHRSGLLEKMEHETWWSGLGKWKAKGSVDSLFFCLDLLGLVTVVLTVSMDQKIWGNLFGQQDQEI